MANPFKLHCPQCGNFNDNMVDANETTVFHCYNCGYPDINWKKERKEKRQKEIKKLEEIFKRLEEENNARSHSRSKR